ncbi:MAG: GNAT family protein [Lentimicrobiaceae bacterium]|jgi:RimJ/RimL family protein N-acetyltransferase
MELKSGNIDLRPLRLADAVRLAELANNEKISCNLRDGFPNPYTLADAENFLKKFTNQDPVTFFGIDYQGEYVGNISLVPGQDVYRKSAEIGYFIGEPYWNNGIVTTAVNLITEYGFNQLGIIRIQTGVFEYNPASMRVLEKCGFTKDGVFRKSVFKQNRIWDEVRYSKINPEFVG